MRRFLLVVAFATTAVLVAHAHSARAADPASGSTATHTVTIEGSPNCGASTFCYTPSMLTVTAGDTVFWVNDTTTAHTVTSPSRGLQGGPSSPTINPSGGTFTFTFTSPGTYNYHSAFRGDAMMHGRITVVPATTTTTGAPTPAPATSPTTTTPSSTSAASETVDINSPCGTAIFCYSPSSLTVTAGDTVVWVNNTTVQHTVTRCTAAACPDGPGTGSQSGPSSGDINPGSTYSFTFTSPGTYNYYCFIHTYALMNGTITVVARTRSTTTSTAPAGASTTVPSSSTTIASTSSPSTPTTTLTTGATSSPAAGSSPTSSATGSDTASGDQLAHTGARVSPEITVGVIVCVIGLGLAAASTVRRRTNSKRS